MSGRPALIIVENWREKMTTSLPLTLPRNGISSRRSLGFSFTFVGLRPCLRSCVRTAASLRASVSPFFISPARPWATQT